MIVMAAQQWMYLIHLKMKRAAQGTQCKVSCKLPAGPASVTRSVVSDSLRPQWIVAHKAPLSIRFSRQEYQSGFPFPSPGDLPDPGTEPRSFSLQADTLPSEPPGRPILYWRFSLVIYFIHSSIYIYVYPNLPIAPLLAPWCPYICPLRPCTFI